jgi:hypothetical protein
MALHADNDGYMRLAKMEPGCVTPRSKKYCRIKYYWFRMKVKSNKVKINGFNTSLQKAAFLTKVLRTKVCESNGQLT